MQTISKLKTSISSHSRGILREVYTLFGKISTLGHEFWCFLHAGWVWWDNIKYPFLWLWVTHDHFYGQVNFGSNWLTLNLWEVITLARIDQSERFWYQNAQEKEIFQMSGRITLLGQFLPWWPFFEVFDLWPWPKCNFDPPNFFSEVSSIYPP